MQSLQHLKNKLEDTIDILHWNESVVIKSLSKLLSCIIQNTFLQEFPI